MGTYYGLCLVREAEKNFATFNYLTITHMNHTEPLKYIIYVFI